jgi:glutamyl-tRNA synthetase
MDKLTPAQFQLLCDASHERSKTLDEMFRANRFFVTPDAALSHERSKNTEKAMLGAAPNGLDHLKAMLPALEGVASWDSASLESAIKAYADTHAGGQLGKVAQPLRIAVSGGTVSPPIFDTLAILGKASTLARAKACVAAFGG